jgi:hypothetical protein
VKIPSVADLEAALAKRGWTIHREAGRLNIVALRRTPGTLDAFDDMLCVVYTAGDGSRHLWACRCTTDPGRPSREKPKRRDGTAVVAVGQLVDGFGIGKHHGDYDCLVPVVPVPVLRYTSIDDAIGDPSTSNSTQIHRASATHESTVVGPWSEGCIVIANPVDFAALMGMAAAQVKTGHRRFTVAIVEWPA